MKALYAVAGAVLGVAIYEFFRPVYRPALCEEEAATVPEDVRLTDLVDELECGLRARTA